MYSLKLLNRQGSKLYKANAKDVPKPRIKLERDGEIEYIALEERENEGAEVGFVVGGKWVYPAKPQPIMDGLICWLDGRDGSNEEQTSVWVDRSGNGNNAVFSSLPCNATEGWTGKSLKLNRSSYGVITGNNQVCFVNDTEFTVEYTFLTNISETYQGVISGAHPTNWYNWIKTSSGDFQMGAWTAGTDITGTNLSGFSNFFVKNTIVWSCKKGAGGFNKSYQNGTFLKNYRLSNNPFNITDIYVGNCTSASVNMLNGEIFSIRLYARALTEEEILHNYEYEKSK